MKLPKMICKEALIKNFVKKVWFQIKLEKIVILVIDRKINKSFKDFLKLYFYLNCF